MISMKKLLGIIVLGLLLSGNAYAKVYNFKKCWYSHFDNYEATTYRWSSFTFKFDLKKKRVYEQRIHTDSILKKFKESADEQYKKYGGKFPTDTEKYQIQDFEIININQDIVRAKLIDSSGVVFPDSSLFFNLNDGTFETVGRIDDSTTSTKTVSNGKCDVRP